MENQTQTKPNKIVQRAGQTYRVNYYAPGFNSYEVVLTNLDRDWDVIKFATKPEFHRWLAIHGLSVE